MKSTFAWSNWIIDAALCLGPSLGPASTFICADSKCISVSQSVQHIPKLPATRQKLIDIYEKSFPSWRFTAKFRGCLSTQNTHHHLTFTHLVRSTKVADKLILSTIYRRLMQFLLPSCRTYCIVNSSVMFSLVHMYLCTKYMYGKGAHMRSSIKSWLLIEITAEIK